MLQHERGARSSDARAAGASTRTRAFCASAALLLAFCAAPSGATSSGAAGVSLGRDAWPTKQSLSAVPAVAWPRGGTRGCGTLRSPGASYGSRRDETDHCFPKDAADHYVCCVDIQSVDNADNNADPTVARYNPLAGPIRRNSDASSYSWCVCSVKICTEQLNGTVAWVGTPGDT